MSDERRQFQRLALAEPLDGWFGDYAVRLVDVSAKGALIESEEILPPNARALLRFYWRGEEVELVAETARTTDARCGLRFVEDNDALRALIALSATEMLRAFEANAAGDREGNAVGDGTMTSAQRMKSSGFVTWTFTPDGWTSRRSVLPDQPADGFTIPASEPDEQVEMLCRTYESGDTEARRLTRMLAELSVTGSA